MASKLIIALDFDNHSTAMALVNQLDPSLCALKIGSEMFTLFGPQFVRALVEKQFKIFLDLKFLDIPNTVAHACAAAAELGVWMINVHASGGLTMMQTARDALRPYGAHRPLLIAVTVLTSMGSDALASAESVESRVCELALLAQKASLDGVVCSVLEVPAIKAVCGGDFITVTPGIRFSLDNLDDQVRVSTPEAALKAGSDYLVVGRPITKASDPQQIVRNLLHTMNVAAASSTP